MDGLSTRTIVNQNGSEIYRKDWGQFRKAFCNTQQQLGPVSTWKQSCVFQSNSMLQRRSLGQCWSDISTLLHPGMQQGVPGPARIFTGRLLVASKFLECSNPSFVFRFSAPGQAKQHLPGRVVPGGGGAAHTPLDSAPLLYFFPPLPKSLPLKQPKAACCGWLSLMVCLGQGFLARART